MGYTISSIKRTRKIIFEGNSLSWTTQRNPDGLNEYYIPRAIAAVAAPTYTPVYFPISGQTQATINSLMATKVLQYSEKGDIVVLWEGTNDLNVGALSAQAAFDNVVIYAQKVVGRGCKLVICTATARDFAGDAADLMTRIDAYNVLVRNNAATYGYTICDLGADPMFDTRADTANATNYSTDLLHLIKPGQDNVISLLTTAVTPLI